MCPYPTIVGKLFTFTESIRIADLAVKTVSVKHSIKLMIR